MSLVSEEQMKNIVCLAEIMSVVLMFSMICSYVLHPKEVSIFFFCRKMQYNPRVA